MRGAKVVLRPPAELKLNVLKPPVTVTTTATTAATVLPPPSPSPSSVVSALKASWIACWKGVWHAIVLAVHVAAAGLLLLSIRDLQLAGGQFPDAARAAQAVYALGYVALVAYFVLVARAGSRHALLAGILLRQYVYFAYDARVPEGARPLLSEVLQKSGLALVGTAAAWLVALATRN
jgi:hypothetical protein